MAREEQEAKTQVTATAVAALLVVRLLAVVKALQLVVACESWGWVKAETKADAVGAAQWQWVGPWEVAPARLVAWSVVTAQLAGRATVVVTAAALAGVAWAAV